MFLKMFGIASRMTKYPPCLLITEGCRRYMPLRRLSELPSLKTMSNSCRLENQKHIQARNCPGLLKLLMRTFIHSLLQNGNNCVFHREASGLVLGRHRPGSRGTSLEPVVGCPGAVLSTNTPHFSMGLKSVSLSNRCQT